MNKEIRKKVQHYKQKVDKANSDKLAELKEVKESERKLRQELKECEEKIRELENKLRSTEEWNSRLLELVDMSEEELNILRLKMSTDSVFGSYTNTMSGLIKTLSKFTL